MIKVNFELNNGLFTAVTIEGHSNFDKKGSDIVCAGVSAVGVGSLNALIEITKTKPHYRMEDGYLYVEFDQSKEAQMIALILSIQLKSIEENYGKYIKITYGR